MYWVLDVLFVAVIALALFFGYRRGLCQMLIGVVASILQFVLVIAGGAGVLLLFYKLGIVDNYAHTLLNIMGETNSLFTLLNMESFDVCQILSAVSILILGLCISAFVFIYLFKLLKLAVDKIPHEGVFGVINGVLGMIVYFAIFGGIMIASMGLINALHANSQAVFQNATGLSDLIASYDEALRSTSICSLVYKYNPLNSIFASMFA